MLQIKEHDQKLTSCDVLRDLVPFVQFKKPEKPS